MGDGVIGLLHPGEMGAAVGACLTARGRTVLWASEGRSAATAARAAAAGLADAGTVARLAAQASIVISVCPPDAALDTARSPGFTGIFLDANAVSPATARQVRALVEAAGASYVDGGIIGPPPTPSAPGGTRLYLAGTRAAEMADLFQGTPLEARLLDGDADTASAVKMAYAAWTKGSAALLLAARALARADGVEDVLLEEWARSQPALAGRSATAAQSAAAKGWRWVGEMGEISASLAEAGLPGGFHQAAAEIFGRPARDSSAGRTEETVHTVLDALLGEGRGPADGPV
jgi:3-hydroxyisobutyrate dehydrogenase-like beta-hydroxyacid dehydrogenase